MSRAKKASGSGAAAASSASSSAAGAATPPAAASLSVPSHHPDNSGAGGDDDDDGPDGGSGKGVSSFISKIYKMVSDPATQDIVSWNERGDGFLVRNEFAFASQIMRTYFRHQNFSSFVRQLNFYGFHKRSSPSQLTSFYHPSFRKGHPELLCQILRKSPETKDAGLRDLVTNLQGEVAELRQQNEDLFKIQQRILYIFSRYMRATQAQQVGGGGGASIGSGGGGGGSVDGGMSAKRIRSGGREGDNKRQRLLMEARPDSPTQAEYHADNYSSDRDRANSSSASSGGYPGSTRPTSEYFGSNSAAGRPLSHVGASGASSLSPNSDNVVDLNTSTYAAQRPNAGAGPYGQHDFSDLNWSTDPVAAIHDLIGKMPGGAQSVLNSSTSMPMHMGRPGGSGAGQHGQAYLMDPQSYAGYGGNDQFTHVLGPRGSGRGGAVSSRGGGSAVNLMDNLSSQLASSNPRELLQMLDRMGADQPALGLSPATRQRAISNGDASADFNGASDSHGISGVFEDVSDSAAAAAPAASESKSSSKSKRSSGAGNKKSSSSSSSGAPAAASSSSRSRRTSAKLSPIDEPIPNFQAHVPSTTASPLLNSLPLPTSPISPFLSEQSTSTDAFPLPAAPANPAAPSNSGSLLPASGSPLPPYADPAGSFSLLHSPAIGMPDLNREGSLGFSSGGGGSHSDMPFSYSPYQGALAPPAGSVDAFTPLTPTHMPPLMPLTSAPPSPTPFRQ